MDASVPVPRRGRWHVWIVIGLILLLGVVAPILLIVAAAASGPRVKTGTIVVVHLEGTIPEAPPQNPLAQLFGGGRHQISLRDLQHLVDTVSADRKVAGVILEVGSLQAGFATVEEARGILAKLHESKKPIQAVLVGDSVGEKEYELALAADRVIVTPEAAMLLNGLVAEVAFYRGSLDKIHVQPQLFQFKEYKSAAEPIMNHEMSAPMRESLQSMIGDLYGRFVADVSQARNIPEDKLKAIFDRGGLTTREALDAKLVDGLGHAEDIEVELRKGQPSQKGSFRMPAAKYLAAARDRAEGQALAVIFGVGTISASNSASLFGGDGIHGQRMAAAIREAAEDDDVKAILIRVNSPGGSAVGSDFVRRAVVAARVKKPVVVSMGDVAASGGYWISMGADAIVAQPSTLTGSIGVVGGKINVRGLYELLGANVDQVKVGANADLMSAYRLFDSAQAERFRAWMGAVYEDFVRGVAEGRGLKYEDVEPNAHGRVWTGAQAKERHLVDELGGLERAIAIAREKAKIPTSAKTHLRRFPHRKSFLEALSDEDFPMVRALLGASDLDAALDAQVAEWETLQPWVLAPKISIH